MSDINNSLGYYKKMKTESNIIHYKNKNDYANKRLGNKAFTKVATDSNTQKLNNLPQDKADISEVAKEKAQELKESTVDKVKDKVSETKSAGKHLLGEAVSSIGRALTTPGVTSIPLPSFGDEGETKPVAEAEKVDDSQIRTIKKPAIIFVGGFSINPFDDGMDGLRGMAEFLPESEFFHWNSESQIMDKIRLHGRDQNVVMVGHGLGSDTIVNIANKLNTLEEGYRAVDLLVTLDSVGFDNDIIPSNVKKNFNYISDQDFFFNDGPNIARDSSVTEVENELRSEAHSDLETSGEVQFKIFEKIENTIGKSRMNDLLEAKRLLKLKGNQKDLLNKTSAYSQNLILNKS